MKVKYVTTRPPSPPSLSCLMFHFLKSSWRSLLLEVRFLVWNSPNTVRRPGDPLAAIRGPTSKGREGKGGKGGEGRRNGGTGGGGSREEGKGEGIREGVHNLRKTTPCHQMAGYGPEVLIIHFFVGDRILSWILDHFPGFFTITG